MKYYSSDPTSWSKTHTLCLDNIAKEAFVYIMKAINFKPWQTRRTIYAQHYELWCRRWELCMGSVVSLWALRDTVNILGYGATGDLLQPQIAGFRMWASRDSTNQNVLFVEWFSRLERAVFRGVYGKIYVLFQAWKFSKSLSSVMSFRKHSKILIPDFGTSLSRDAFSTASRLKWGTLTILPMNLCGSWRTPPGQPL